MRSDTFTKTVLTIIALPLAVLAGKQWKAPVPTVHAAPVQTWEYKIVQEVAIYRTGNSITDSYSYYIGDWEIYEGENKISGHISQELDHLGAQGWELVSVTGITAPNTKDFSVDEVKGATTHIDYVFKRPKRM
jgi:hypothetical protein